MACSPCADLCVCLSIYQHVNLNAHSVCTEVCLSAFSPEFVTANGYNSRPGAYSTGSSGNSSQGKLWRIRRIWYVFFGIFNQRNVEYSSDNLLTCFSNLNSYSMSVCVCLQATVALMEDTQETTNMHQITQQHLQHLIQAGWRRKSR